MADDGSSFSVVVEGGRPWGFTLMGGLEFRAPLRVGKVTPGGKAEKAGIIAGDYITSINNTEVKGLKHLDAKQLVLKATATLQLSCTKVAPFALFSPTATKPSPQFTFTSSRSPSPSSQPPLATRSRPRVSSFSSLSSYVQPRPRSSSFTSPVVSPGTSAGKSLSLKRPPPPAVVMPTSPQGRSDTLPNGRPKPPVNYQGDIANSSSGVSSSVSSAASSPPPHSEGGVTLNFSPSHQIHHHHPPPLSHVPQSSNRVTVDAKVIPTDTADAKINTDEIIPISNPNKCASEPPFASDKEIENETLTTDTLVNSTDPVDTGNTVTDTTDTTDPVDTGNTVTDTTDTTDAVDARQTTPTPADETVTQTDSTNTAGDTTDTITDAVTDTTASTTDSTDTDNVVSVATETVEKKDEETEQTVTEREGEDHPDSIEENEEEEKKEEKEEEEGKDVEGQRDDETAKITTSEEESVVTSSTVSSEQQEPHQTDIDKQLEDARRAREAEMKARAHSLLTGKLGSLVRSSRPSSAPVSKPPLPPSASMATKPPRPPATGVPKSPQRVPVPPGSPSRTAEKKREAVPVIKPYLVKKEEETTSPKDSMPDRTMAEIKMAHRMPGWYKEMFQGFQQTVEELFPGDDVPNNAQHSRTKSTPAEMDAYVYDHRGLKVKKATLTTSSFSSPVSPVHARTKSANINPPDPVYVYDHRGLRVKRDSLPATSETEHTETTPTTDDLGLQEEVTTADVLASSRRQYSMDSGYDDRGLRLREGSLGNGDTDNEQTTVVVTATEEGEEMTKEEVVDVVKKPTSFKSDKFTTEPSRTYWSAIDQQFAEDQKKKAEAQEVITKQEEEVEEAKVHRRDNSKEPTPEEERMSHMHPLLTEGLENVSTVPSTSSGEVFDRIDAQKLAGALDNAKTLGTMEQEGVPSNMLPLNPQQRDTAPKEPEKLPPPGKKGRALFSFEGKKEKELSFEKGDIIDLLHTVNENWLEGMLGQTKGIFPTNYVQVLSHEELRETLAKENAPMMQARATYDFDPQNDRELQFKKDDIIVITKKIDDNWFQGYLGDQKGIFPSSYVEVLEDTN